jgi:beta-glucosidase
MADTDAELRKRFHWRKGMMVNRQAPSGFRWGAATSAYQIEGAVVADGRGESIWDRFVTVPGAIRNGDTGTVACDHYRRPERDVALLAELGLNAYRYSIAWPRIQPLGRGSVNPRGLDFYDRLVDRLLARGLEPHVTLYHWDLPQALEDAGGWPVRGTAEAFAEYAGVVARRIGDRAASIATINEPFVAAELGYGIGIHAPGRREPKAARAAAHHLLVAHGLAVQAIRAAAPRVPVGIVLNFEPKTPASADPADIHAAELAHARMNRWYLEPVVGLGYPAAAVGELGWQMTEVEPGDLDLIAEPITFLGVNYYTREVVRSREASATPDAGVERTGIGWEVHPQGLTEVLEFVHSRTGTLPLFVTENGAAYPDGPNDPARDPERCSYLHRHVHAALDAVERGVPLRGYFVWSLLDNFEWTFGYGQRFGVVHVDFATQRRTIRDSGRLLASMVRDGVPPLHEPAGVGAAGSG